MFPKKQRLTKQKEIKAVFEAKNSYYNESFGLKFKRNNLEQNRYTIIIGKKISKSAVERNLIKRRVKSILRENDIRRKYFYDFVIVCLKGSEKLNYQETKERVEKLLFKIK